MKRYALILGAAAILAVGCNKGGSKLDGEWSMLVSGTDGGSQSMKFSDNKNWVITSVFEQAGAKYITTLQGTYTLVEDGKKLTITTTGGDLKMEGGSDKAKKDFERQRKAYLENLPKGTSDTSTVRWLNDNSFETEVQGSTITFHRR